LDPQLLDEALADALAAAAAQGVRGKAVSPFLLDWIQRVTGGVSVGVNLDIARGNVDLAAKISRSWSQRAPRRAPPFPLSPPAAPRLARPPAVAAQGGTPPPCPPAFWFAETSSTTCWSSRSTRWDRGLAATPWPRSRPGQVAPRPTRPPGWLTSASTWCSR